MTIEEKAQLYKDLVTQYESTLLDGSQNAAWLVKEVGIRVMDAHFLLGAIYVHAMNASVQAINETRHFLSEEARQARSEIHYPAYMLLNLYTAMTVVCGKEGKYNHLMERLMAVERALHIRPVEEQLPGPGGELFSLMTNLVDTMVDGAVIKNKNVPVEISAGLQEFRRHMHSSSGDPLTKMGTSLSATLSTDAGKSAMAFLQQMTSGEPIVESAFNHLAAATSMEDAIRRGTEITTNPDIINMIQQKTTEAVNMAAMPEAAPVNETPEMMEDFPVQQR